MINKNVFNSHQAPEIALGVSRLIQPYYKQCNERLVYYTTDFLHTEQVRLPVEKQYGIRLNTWNVTVGSFITPYGKWRMYW